jgi:hypothetical protein
MASGLYAKGIVALGNGAIDFDTSNIRLSLHTNSASVDLNTHDFLSDVTNEIANGSGYTTSGQTVANCTVTSTAAVIKFAGDNTTWTAATISARYGVLYKNTGSGDSSSWPVLALFDFGSTQSSSSGTFNVAWSSGGIFTITVN